MCDINYLPNFTITIIDTFPGAGAKGWLGFNE
jgi:hypothetical protein